MPIPENLLPFVDELVERGADVVWLGGSHARDEAHDLSDVDLGVIGPRGAGPGYRLSMAGGHLVSVSWVTLESMRSAFSDPAQVGAAVPGWRRAELLWDPDAIGDGLRREATSWNWDSISEASDRWVAEQITGYAEEVFKLSAAVEAGDLLKAEVQRSVLALRMAFVLSVHERILYDSENRLWSLVADTLGEPWQETQVAALNGSADAAFRLYRLAADRVKRLLDARQRLVVDAALGVSET